MAFLLISAILGIFIIIEIIYENKKLENLKNNSEVNKTIKMLEEKNG